MTRTYLTQKTLYLVNAKGQNGLMAVPGSSSDFTSITRHSLPGVNNTPAGSGALNNGIKREEGVRDEFEDVKVNLGRSQWADEYENFVRGRKRKWAAMGFDESHMNDLEEVAIQ